MFPHWIFHMEFDNIQNISLLMQNIFILGILMRFIVYKSVKSIQINKLQGKLFVKKDSDQI